MSELPDGVVTFLFTDVEGSTRMWEEAPDLMMEALQQHDQAIDEAVTAHDGVSVKPRGEGDSRFVVFPTALEAVAAAADIQRLLSALDWATPTALRVRTSLHTGTAELQLGDYYGSAVNRAARLRAIAHGGQTVMSAATHELVRDRLPDNLTIRDMGEHGLKDLTRPEHVYQLDVDGLEVAFPPLASLDAVPNNLPQQLTEFVGRESELAEAKRLLGETRLLTILAPGGTGKTRLAIQAAADLTADYPDGVFFIGLADISSSGDIVQTVAESLGLSLSSDDDLQTQLLTYLTNKRQLLVFDNFEHLTDSALIITEILQAASELTVVATSRAKLNLTGETVLTLGGLETTWDAPEDAMQASAVRLFIDAAKRVKPGFVVESDDLDSLAEILQRTGGMPLAILLAAAWVDMLAISEIAAEITKSLDFLETELGDIPDRQRSVRAVFDYSWQLLNEEERTTFAALSVFRGGFTRDAASAVAGASLRNLAILANKSLVTPSPDAGRYTVHELLRQYAAEELEKDPDRFDQALEAHAGYYGDLTEQLFGRFHMGGQPLIVATIEDDIDNIRSAWRHFLSRRNAVGARKIVIGLWAVSEARGWFPGAVSLYNEALDAFDPNSDDPPTLAVRALSTALQSWFLALMGQPDVAAGTAQEAVEVLRGSSDPVALWLGLQGYALCLAYLGRAEEMVEACEEALAVGETLEHPFWAAGMKSWRSFAAILEGDTDTAKRLLPEGMEVLAALDEHFFLVWNLWLQAMIATQEERPEDALDLYARQVERAQELGYPRGTMVAQEGLGDTNVEAGNLEEAETAFVAAFVTAEQMGMVREMLGMITKVAKIRATMGHEREAVEMLATVVAESVSSQQLFTENISIKETAVSALAEFEKDLGPDEYSAAYAKGASRPYDVIFKDLLGGHTPGSDSVG